ncbi:MAG: tetratricopeptide repeat protein [Thermodesulfovibrionales bacterium]|nr:tetratricopeptide repeat protein [Thermodesulfovibrionales bacterium]
MLPKNGHSTLTGGDDDISSLIEALTHNPSDLDLLNRLGIYYANKNNLNDAIKVFQKALRLDNTNAIILYNLANAYKQKSSYKQAINLYKKAISLDNQLYQAFFQLGNIYLEMGLFKDAAQSFISAIEIKPDYKEALCNLGVCYYRMCKVIEAIDIYKKVLNIDPDYPDAHYNLALALFILGDYKNAFSEYEWRFKTNLIKPFYTQKPYWNGEITDGLKLHIRCEQGFGDMIQFIRFIKNLLEMRLKITVSCPPQLLALFRNSFQDVIFLENEPDDFNYFIHLMSLPRILKIGIEDVPNDIPYIYPRLFLIDQWAKRLNLKDDILKVGICWKGSNTNVRGQYRSIPTQEILPILCTKDVVFISLMKEKACDLNLTGINLFDYSDEFYDFEHTAGLIENLDIIITIDTAIAHLAGAMGKTVWLLLHYSSDWRWMLNRSDSPWYPTMRIFRQTELNDWKTVIKKVKEELEEEKSRGKYQTSPLVPIYQDIDKTTLLNRCKMLILSRSNEKAISCLKELIEKYHDYPEAHWELALLLLKNKDFKNGWQHYEWRKILPQIKDYYTYPKELEWDGKIVKNRRILVYDEQGFGDSIQFLRFVRLMIEKGMLVTIMCRDELVRLFKTFSDLCDVIPRSKPSGEYNCVTSIMSLPYLLSITEDRLQTNTPYFQIHKDDVLRWRSYLTNRINIGFALTSRKPHPKEIELSSFMPIFDVEGACFFNLEKKQVYIDRVNNISTSFNDFYDTASFILNLDLVISVDTAVAHLAGALNKEVWLMLHYDSDWRWFDDEETTVWYPSMRIFKQRQSGNWHDVVDRIKIELLKRVLV